MDKCALVGYDSSVRVVFGVKGKVGGGGAEVLLCWWHAVLHWRLEATCTSHGSSIVYRHITHIA